MGCYDTIHFKCPSCSAAVEVQTKIGECVLADFNEKSVPIHLATGIIGSTLYCESCFTEFRIEPVYQLFQTIPLKLVEL